MQLHKYFFPRISKKEKKLKSHAKVKKKLFNSQLISNICKCQILFKIILNFFYYPTCLLDNYLQTCVHAHTYISRFHICMYKR